MGLSTSVGLGVPTNIADRQLTARGAVEARAGLREVEVCLGVGASPASLPARVLAHAACVAKAIQIDTPRLVGPATRIRIFSSAPKTKVFNSAMDFAAVATLGLALRKCGVMIPILVEPANAEDEIADDIDVALTDAETAWLARASARSANGADPRQYALEHAANSMFGDIDLPDAPFRVTIGAAPEAKFWAIRNRVRGAALNCGLTVAPAAVLVLKACRIPWYSPTQLEPSFDNARTIHAAIEQLDAAANPSRGGNTGINGEARALHRFAATDAYHYLREAHSSLLADVCTITRLSDFLFGANARRLITTGDD